MSSQIKIEQIRSNNAGSIIFSKDGGTLSEDPNLLVWDFTNNNLGIGLNNPTSRLTVIDNRNLPTINITNSYSNLISWNQISYAGLIKHIGNSQNGMNIGLISCARNNLFNNVGLIALSGLDDIDLQNFYYYYLYNSGIGIYSHTQKFSNNSAGVIGYKHVDLVPALNNKEGINITLTGNNNYNIQGINLYITTTNSSLIYGNKIYIGTSPVSYSSGVIGDNIEINYYTYSSYPICYLYGSFINLFSYNIAETIGSYIKINPNSSIDDNGNNIIGQLINFLYINNAKSVSNEYGIKININNNAINIYGINIDIINNSSLNTNIIYGIKVKCNYSASNNVYAAYFSAIQGINNYAAYFNAENGTNNYALVTENGKVGFGTVTPVKKFEIALDEVRIGALTSAPQPGYVLGAMNTSGDVDWLNPATLPGLPKKYVERNVQLIANTPYTVNHNLNTMDIVVEMVTFNSTDNSWDKYITKIYNKTFNSFEIIPSIDITVDIIVIG